ncbi:DUF6896 domain-containing protein [Hymenobacter volaticus]|uniref:DUF6896 domain-containing protein n=1 Tax=Hymenobacter volaticus TaxID=2932254 RepID=A0ABY4GF50_9BACT|nr:hypothetical protein [Hymenobacter volaticus]UOQ69513.1 hypothetical protein MUN86_28135 [Hymenobacter volaticus]
MLLHGTLSLSSAPPARWVTQDQLEEGQFLCFWSETLPYTFGARLHAMPEGPVRLGQTKRAILSVSVEAGEQAGLRECLPIGTASQEAIGQFALEAKEIEPERDLPFGALPLSDYERESLTEVEQQLFCCIEQWVQQANQLCSALREAFQLDFTRLGRMERNARMGRKGTIKGICYAFHGIGCYFEGKDVKLDVDFDSQGNWRGFDVWRVQSFIDWNYPELGLSPARIEQGIEELLRKKWLYQVAQLYGPFYYVTPVAITDLQIKRVPFWVKRKKRATPLGASVLVWVILDSIRSSLLSANLCARAARKTSPGPRHLNYNSRRHQ